MERYIPDRWGGSRSSRTGGASWWVRASLEPGRSVRAQSELQVCESFLPSAPGLRHQSVSPYSAQVARTCWSTAFALDEKQRLSEAAAARSKAAAPCGWGRAQGFVSSAWTSEGSNLRDEAGDKKEIESGRDDNELKNWWVFLASARRCKNPLPPAAYRILFDSGGGGLWEVCLQADRKVESSVTRIRWWNGWEWVGTKQRVTDTYVYVRLPWSTEKCLLGV